MQGDHSALGARIRTLEHHAVSAHSRVRFRTHYLAFRDGKPAVDELMDALDSKLVGFCLPRRDINEAFAACVGEAQQRVVERMSALAGRARRLFIQSHRALGRSGEAGELLLYLLTEWILGAPQIIAKMSLKTNAQMAVHGSDGVHVRFDPVEKELFLYWGEAKVHKSVGRAIGAAVESVQLFMSGGLSAEIALLKAHHHMADLPADARDALLEFLDPYSEKANARCDVSTCLIMFDFEEFGGDLPNDQREVHFRDALQRALAKFATQLDQKLADAGLNDHRIEVFLLPVPSVDSIRAAFQKLIGWPA